MKTHSMAIPRATCREACDGILMSARQEILAEAQALAEGGYPPLPARLYMAFVRDGSRKTFETPYFARRQRLIRAVLAECLTYTGQYLDDIIDGLLCICEESTWCISAHNESGAPLADVSAPAIDLFAAQTAALLSWTCYLLEDTLLPIVTARVETEIRTRILVPFCTRDDFWWMGVVRKDLNNWTPWILSNVLAMAHIWGEDVDARAATMLQRWLDCIPEDGGLDEGVAYWNMAGGSLLDCLDHLGQDRYGESKVRNLAAFPLHAHIAGSYFLNFADCDAQPMLDGERIYTFGKRIKNPALQALGASLCAQNPSIFPRDTPEFYRTLCRLFTPVDPVPLAPQEEEQITLPNLQLWIRRKGRYYIAAKGGHNGESHNHNDVGALILFIDGLPAIVDAGNMVYTAHTFRDETRYTLWNTRSQNHNVPIIGTHEQAAGASFCAQGVVLESDRVRMDIAGAYPASAGITALHREFQLLEDGVSLTDRITLEHNQPVQWIFLLRHAPMLRPREVDAGNVQIRHDESLSASVEPYPVEDARMARNYPGILYRLILCAKPGTAHHQTFLLKKLEP